MKNWVQWKSTVIGLVGILVPIVVAVGWVDAAKQDALVLNMGTFVEALWGFAGAILGVWGVFKNNDNTD